MTNRKRGKTHKPADGGKTTPCKQDRLRKDDKAPVQQKPIKPRPDGK